MIVSTKRPKLTSDVTPVARPSMPSVMFTALDMPAIMSVMTTMKAPCPR